jgi:hypothetical protein
MGDMWDFLGVQFGHHPIVTAIVLLFGGIAIFLSFGAFIMSVGKAIHTIAGGKPDAPDATEALAKARAAGIREAALILRNERPQPSVWALDALEKRAKEVEDE